MKEEGIGRRVRSIPLEDDMYEEAPLLRIQGPALGICSWLRAEIRPVGSQEGVDSRGAVGEKDGRVKAV
jgi:hypothetical protein